MRGIKWLIGVVIIFSGLYIGIWEMFIGGIVDVIDQVRADTIDEIAIAIGIAKVVFCEIPIAISIVIGQVFFYE